MKYTILITVVFISFIMLFGCEDEIQGPVVDLENNGYERVAVAEVLVKTCASSGCHSGTNPAGGLSTQTHSNIIRGSVNRNPAAGEGFGGEVLIPFNAEKSLVYQVLNNNVTPIDPHENLNIESAKIDIVKEWIDQGARDYDGNVPLSNPSYRIFVCNQASDIVSVVDGDNWVVSRITDVSQNQTIDAPHMIKEYGEFYYVSLIAAGKLLKIRKSDNQIINEASGIERAGMVQLTSDGTTAFVSRSSTSPGIYNSVYAVSLDNMNNISEISLPVTGVPHAIALTPDNKTLYVANLTKDRLSVVNAETFEFVEDIILDNGTEPMQASISPDGSLLYVSGMGSNKLIVINTTTNEIITDIEVNHMPMHIAVSSDGNMIYVATMMMSTVDVIEKNGNTWSVIKRISHPGFNMLHGCDLSPNDDHLFVSSRNLDGKYEPQIKINGEGNNGTLGIINTQTLEVVKVIDLKEFPSGLTAEANHH